MTTPTTWLEVALAATFPLTLLVALWNRHRLKRSIGTRTIQFVAVAMIIPGVVLLALRGLLVGEAVAAIFGGVVGYLLSNIAKFDDRNRDAD